MLRRLTHVGIVTLVLVACLLVLERYQIRNNFSILPGDRYDGVISTAILEHWYNVFRGTTSWLDVNYFFPYERTIAQTDAYFLVGLAYLPFRLLGFDQFLSHEFAGVVIKTVGFISCYILSNKFIKLPFGYALLASALFTLSNGMTTHSSRLQLATVAFAPLLAIFIWMSIRAFMCGERTRFVAWGAASGAFYGAWCLTCFYMALVFRIFRAFSSGLGLWGLH